jgi:eukaryotic-like serine/threonine-protein kinase
MPDTSHGSTDSLAEPLLDESTLRASDPPPSSRGFVPSLPHPAPPVVTNDPLKLSPGQQIDDYQIAAVLGRGAFGVVYLAWQVSLGRQIALKVSPSVGQEGRTLARLDHPHIVRVHSESHHNGLRMLCMQYVPSIDLENLLDELKGRAPTWTGADLLGVIDARLTLAAEFDPAQLADRQRLSELGHVDAVCWIIARLADAVGHAHRHGVLHRDLKPGNVLVSQYGRPMLVDFNLADFTRDVPHGSQVFGGTLPFMSPEHLDAFNPEHPATPADVTELSDIYSLGVMLYRMLTGELPFAAPAGALSPTERVRQMAAERRDPEKLWSQPQLVAEPALLSALQRCLAPAPADRWRSGDELASALDGVIDLRQTLHRVATSGPCPNWLRRRPFTGMLLLGLTPHLLGSLVNIPYNLVRIVGPDRQDVFWWLVNVYNAALYPGCIALCYALIRPVYQDWQRRKRGDVAIDPEETAQIRRRVLAFPWWAVVVALIGWLPGAVWFPWGLHVWAGPLSWGHVLHLQLSVALSGLIALTYSALGVLCLTSGIFYPKLCTDPLAFRARAAEDVRPLLNMARVIPFLAGAIPLAGAALLVGSSPQSFTDSEYFAFRWLTTGLIALGTIGFQVALVGTGIAKSSLEAFLTPPQRRFPLR